MSTDVGNEMRGANSGNSHNMELDAPNGTQSTTFSLIDPEQRIKIFYLFSGTILLAAWWLVYQNLLVSARFITYQILHLDEGSHFGATVEFFVFETPKVLLLLTLIVFFVGIIRSYFTPERTRLILAGNRESVGHLLAGGLGVVTPFCSCSAVPLFMGFLTAGVPLGVTFSFLISAPMVNEIALVLLFGLFGWKVAALYMAMGLTIAILSGVILGKMNMESYLEDWVTELVSNRPGTELFTVENEIFGWKDRIDFGIEAVKDIVFKVWPYVTLGIAVGAGIHGYVPENFLAGVMGKDAWWAVPAAVVIGVPMYSNAAGVIPVVQALLAKGAAFGTVLAFMMAVVGLSLPEAIILRKVLKPRLLAVFIGVVTVGIILVGYLFNVVL